MYRPLRIAGIEGHQDPDTVHAGAALYILMSDSYIKEMVSDHLSDTTELLAILLGLQWREEREINCVIASDSLSALTSIRSDRLSFRTDIINEIFLRMNRVKIKGISTCFFWVPAHAGVKGNEQVDILAKLH